MMNNTETFKKYLYKLIKEELEDENPEENPTGDVSLKDITIGWSIITDDPDKVEVAINDLNNYGDKQRQAVTIAQHIKKAAGEESKAMKLIPSGNAAGRNNIVKWSLTNVWAKLSKQERLTKLNQVFKAYKAEGINIGEDLRKTILKFDPEADISDDTKLKEYIANLEASNPIFTKVGPAGTNIGYPIFKKGYFYPVSIQKSLDRSPLRKDFEYTIEDKDGKSEFIFLVKDNPLADLNMGNTDAYRDLLKKIAKASDEKLNTLSKQVFSDTGEDANTTISAPIKEPSSEVTNFVKTFTDDEGEPDEEGADKFYAMIFGDFPNADITDNKISVNDITPAEKKDLINRYLKFQQSNKLYENKLPMKNQLKEQLTSIIKEVLLEKKLTPAKLKKRNKEAEIIKKKNPKMDKGEAFAIATKHLKEGEDNMSMDDIIEKFVQALDIKDDQEANQALKAVGVALKNKVKGKFTQAANYAKDKLNKYNDSLEERVGRNNEPVLFPTSLATKINSQVVDAQTLADQLLTVFKQIQSKEAVDFSKNQNLKYVIQYLNRAMGEKPGTTPSIATASTKKPASTTAPNTPPSLK